MNKEQIRGEAIKDEAISILSQKLDTVNKCVRLGLRQFRQIIHTQEEADALVQAIKYLKSEPTPTDLINGYPVKVLQRFRYEYGQRMLQTTAAKQNKAIRELARKCMSDMDLAIEFLTIKSK